MSRVLRMQCWLQGKAAGGKCNHANGSRGRSKAPPTPDMAATPLSSQASPLRWWQRRLSHGMK